MENNYVGKRLDGRYEIHEVLGVGGMAVVYKAYDRIDAKTVAVKILKDEYLTDEEFKRRFKNESKAIAVLSHKNIVKVLDVSLGDRLQYIVMEYVDGITLKEYIQQQGKIKIREALYFIIQILQALSHAHDKGIVHRDIKPQNIMLINDGTIKVTDFGIATFSRGETRNMSESAIGSVHYISPEQAKGHMTDAKSDIYSVGVVLYEMLTGCVPFQSDSAVSVAVMQVQKEPKKPSELNPDIPVGLEQIIMRAMQKNPAERYLSAAEMLVDISEFAKNPAIKFDYSYFVDKQPTKYIPANEVNKKLEDDSNQEENRRKAALILEERKRKRTVGILAGVLGGLLIFVILMVVIFVSGSGKWLTVPGFVGLNYAEEIASNDEYAEYWSYIEAKFVESKDADDGVVISQTPEKGKKISENKKIILEVASNNTKVIVPDVYGYDIATAQSTLRREGFFTSIDYIADTQQEEGTVVKTSPERNERAVSGSTVIIYIPGEGAGSEKMVMVPILAGGTLSSAKKDLESVGLELDVNGTTYRDSDRPKGQIIGNAFAGQEVPKGTKIAVYISSGVQSHMNVSYTLPNVGEKGNVVIKLNGEEVENMSVKLDGSERKIYVGGSGSNKKFEVFVDGQKIYSARLDFSTSLSENMITAEETFEYTTEPSTEPTVKPTAEPTEKKTEPTVTSEPTEVTLPSMEPVSEEPVSTENPTESTEPSETEKTE